MKKTNSDSIVLDLKTTNKAFTQREKEVIQLLALGKTNKEIAKLLFISSETVKSHIKNLFRKTNTCSRTALIAKSLAFSTNSTDESKHLYQIVELIDNTGC